jgi:dihydrofolate synthase / folylpolyglutamate synthase
MSYAAAIEQLNAMAPELFTRPGQPRRKFSLDEIRVLLEAMGNPHTRFRSVLIAGTNGKGSTAATLASILIESGLKTGLYTSPHLERVNERIRIGRSLIPDDDFARCFFRVDDLAQELVRQERLPQLPSFFEFLTALAFAYFADAAIDVAVLEVGMGGRLDATNVVDPMVSVVTDISLDHMEWLGSTIAQIAREKAGILRRDGTLVTLPQHPEANQVLGEAAEELNVRGVSATPYMPGIGAGAAQPYTLEILGSTIEIASPLAGAHQHRNVALAIAAAVELRERHNLAVTPEAIAVGVRRTNWPGRLECIAGGGIEWILDVAHNAAGAWALRAGLRDLSADDARPRILIFSCLRDKPVAELAQILFPLFDEVIFAPIHSLRATPAEDLLAAAKATGTPATVAGSVADALDRARAASPQTPVGATTSGRLIVISGSVYLVGEARSFLMSHTRHKPEACL